MTNHNAPQARDFDKGTRDALLNSGIRIVGVQALPVAGSYTQIETGYIVDDNGMARVWTRQQVLMRAAGQGDPTPYKLFEDGSIGQWKGGAYRFYCYTSSWAISPAARGGYILEGV